GLVPTPRAECEALIDAPVQRIRVRKAARRYGLGKEAHDIRVRWLDSYRQKPKREALAVGARRDIPVHQPIVKLAGSEQRSAENLTVSGAVRRNHPVRKPAGGYSRAGFRAFKDIRSDGLRRTMVTRVDVFKVNVGKIGNLFGEELADQVVLIRCNATRIRNVAELVRINRD